MTSTPESEAEPSAAAEDAPEQLADDAPSGAAVDPQNFPPYDLNADQAQAVHGRLADVDPDYAPAGSDQAAQATPRPPHSVGLREGEGGGGLDEIEAEAEEAKQANIDAGAAGAGDDTTGREVTVWPEPPFLVNEIAPESAPEGDEVEGEAPPETEPEGEAESEGETEPEPEVDPEADADDDDPESLTVAELKAELDEAGVEYDKYALKADLVQAVREARA